MKNREKTKKKYQKKDLEKFIFHGKDPSLTDLSTTYKDYLYGHKSKFWKND